MNGIIPFEIPGFEIHAVWQEEREMSSHCREWFIIAEYYNHLMKITQNLSI
jgi:hypothetical protein